MNLVFRSCMSTSNLEVPSPFIQETAEVENLAPVLQDLPVTPSSPPIVQGASLSPRPKSSPSSIHHHRSMREIPTDVAATGANTTPPTSPQMRSVFTQSNSQGNMERALRSSKTGSMLLSLISPISIRNTQVELGRQQFTTFLQRCYSQEVLEFWDETTRYIRLAKHNSTKFIQVARSMIEEYVLPNSPQKLDLGWEIEDPLLAAYEGEVEFTAGSFDRCRWMLLKLMQGLKMDASVSFGGVKTPNALVVGLFLEGEERKMHQLRFQRDVHPLLHLLRRSTTVGSNPVVTASASSVVSAIRRSAVND